ncbi:hypothetical protein F4806DRAFT_277981 [Annulohypoxylon nitens]|nr:hypothetical protein F4806DRAFT_277981 [Annulohypoxylon nitens]
MRRRILKCAHHLIFVGTGCFMCKLRKVKCNEDKPVCGNCLRFGFDCTPNASPTNTALFVGPSNRTRGVGRSLRGRGRPRNNWATTGGQRTSTAASSRTPPSPPSTKDTTESPESRPGASLWATSDIELLLHYTSSTALSLSPHTSLDDPIAKFWAYNVPRMGLDHHFLLRLIFSISAFHLTYLHPGERQAISYTELARQHYASGLAEFTIALNSPDASNGGALLVASILVCYCTFAAGPNGSGDLLVCNTDVEAPSPCQTLIHGVRILRETLDPAVLYSGLMKPLFHNNPNEDATQNSKPSCSREDCPSREWQKPLGELRCLVTSSETPDTPCYIHALDELISIYEAVHGDESGTYTGPPEKKHIFGWLYRMKPPFIACLKRKERLALLILAYYAVLFQTMEKCWYLDGWMEHLILNINAVTGMGFSRWMQWPMSQLAESSSTPNDSPDLRDEGE